MIRKPRPSKPLPVGLEGLKAASHIKPQNPNPSMTVPVSETLSDLRVEIDRIDAAMHELLIERGSIIDRIIAAKARAGGGSAFRPEREATMMRHILERHTGQLPLDTVEGIWRVIISTFTYVQAAYAVHADGSGGDAAMRDVARFHFGFTVPLIQHDGPGPAIDALLVAPGDLGLVRIEGGATSGPWWHRLIPTAAPKIIARLPFVDRVDHPAGTPVFVLAKPSAASASREVVLYAASVDRWRSDFGDALKTLGGEVVEQAADDFGLSLLLALPGRLQLADLRSGLAATGDLRLAEVGSHAAPFDLAVRRVADAKG